MTSNGGASSSVPAENQRAEASLEQRAGTDAGASVVEELRYVQTPYDLQRRLCDHHLLKDLVSSLVQLYFWGRFGTEFRLSSIQGVLLYGSGLQFKSVDDLTKETGLPGNQVLDMFNKAVRKMSAYLRRLMEAEEESKLLGGEAREKAEKDMEKMGDVTGQTLVEDTEEAAVAGNTR